MAHMNQEHPLSLVIKVMKPSVPMHDLAALLATATKNSEDENRRIYADAASGVGPQPWERDWPLGEFDLVDHLTSAEFNADDLVLSHLLMMVQWALDSHLGRQADIYKPTNLNRFQDHKPIALDGATPSPIETHEECQACSAQDYLRVHLP